MTGALDDPNGVLLLGSSLLLLASEEGTALGLHGDDQFEAGIQARIAIAAAEAIRKQGTGFGSSQDFRDLVIPCRFMHVAVGGFRISSP